MRQALYGLEPCYSYVSLESFGIPPAHLLDLRFTVPNSGRVSCIIDAEDMGLYWHRGMRCMGKGTRDLRKTKLRSVSRYQLHYPVRRDIRMDGTHRQIPICYTSLRAVRFAH